MAKAKEFLKRLEDADPETREKLIDDNTPVVSDNPHEVFEHIYQVSKDAWKYDTPEKQKLWPFFFENIKEFVTGSSVLDLGVGRAHVWQYFQNQGCFLPNSVIGLDISETACKMADEKKIPFLKTVADDMSRHDFVLPEVDVIFSVSTLYYPKAADRKILLQKIADSNAKTIITVSTKYGKEEFIHHFPSRLSDKWELSKEFHNHGYHGFVWSKRK